MLDNQELIMHIGFDSYANRISSALLDEVTGDREARVIDLDDDGANRARSLEVVRRFIIISRTVTDLRRGMAHDLLMPASSDVVMVIKEVAWWHTVPIPSPTDEDLCGYRFAEDGHIRKPDPWRNVDQLTVSRGRNCDWIVTCKFKVPVPAALVVAAVCRSVAGHRERNIGSLQSPTGPAAIRPGLHDPEDGTATPYITRWQLLQNFKSQDGTGGGDHAIPGRPHLVDESSVNPTGFQKVPTEGIGSLEQLGDGYCVRLRGCSSMRLPASGDITEVDISRLRPMRAIRLGDPPGFTESERLTKIAINLAAAGVPLLVSDSREWIPILGAEFSTLMADASEWRLVDNLYREEHSIRLRRYALENYSARKQWRDIVGAARVPLLGTPRVSVVLCTKRADMLDFAIDQIARQRGVEVDLVVVLHGVKSRDTRVMQAISKYEGDVRVAEVGSHVVFGEALNVGIKHVSAGFVAKMDDDDWYGPHHLSDLILSQRYSGADLVGSKLDFIYLEESNKTIRVDEARQTEVPSSFCSSYRDGLMGGTILITRNAVEELGGFKPVPRSEDSELCCAVRAAGGRVYVQHSLNYIYRRRKTGDHTWDISSYDILERARSEWPGLYLNGLMR